VEQVEACVHVLHFVLQLLVGTVMLLCSSGMMCGPSGGMGMLGSLVGTLELVSRTTVCSSRIK